MDFFYKVFGINQNNNVTKNVEVPAPEVPAQVDTNSNKGEFPVQSQKDDNQYGGKKKQKKTSKRSKKGGKKSTPKTRKNRKNTTTHKRK